MFFNVQFSNPPVYITMVYFKLQGYYIFGRDLMAIPCLRSSALAGFAASFGVGLTHFLFTSHATKSIHYAQIAFVGVMFPYW